MAVAYKIYQYLKSFTYFSIYYKKNINCNFNNYKYMQRKNMYIMTTRWHKTF